MQQAYNVLKVSQKNFWIRMSCVWALIKVSALIAHRREVNSTSVTCLPAKSFLITWGRIWSCGVKHLSILYMWKNAASVWYTVLFLCTGEGMGGSLFWQDLTLLAHSVGFSTPYLVSASRIVIHKELKAKAGRKRRYWVLTTPEVTRQLSLRFTYRWHQLCVMHLPDV